VKLEPDLDCDCVSQLARSSRSIEHVKESESATGSNPSNPPRLSHPLPPSPSVKNQSISNSSRVIFFINLVFEGSQKNGPKNLSSSISLLIFPPKVDLKKLNSAMRSSVLLPGSAGPAMIHVQSSSRRLFVDRR
jgi:hypothetical protein